MSHRSKSDSFIESHDLTVHQAPKVFTPFSRKYYSFFTVVPTWPDAPEGWRKHFFFCFSFCCTRFSELHLSTALAGSVFASCQIRYFFSCFPSVHNPITLQQRPRNQSELRAPCKRNVLHRAVAPQAIMTVHVIGWASETPAQPDRRFGIGFSQPSPVSLRLICLTDFDSEARRWIG